MSLNDHSSKRVSGKQTAALEPSPYCHLLPASYRTRHDDVAIPTLTPSYLYEQLDVRRLNAIHKWLWLTGRPTPPRPLHYQNAVGRAIVVHEQTDLHLVWDEHRIFLKPIPAYLLEKGVWQDVLTCTSSCDDTSRMKSCAQATRRLPDGESEEKGLYGEDISEGASCDVCQVAALARGFLLSYASLISHESDLHIARSSHLIPETITWQQWRDTVKALLSSTPSSPFAPATFPSSSSSVDTGSSLQTMVNRRYHYGELRLDRLNKIYVLTLRAPLRGYLYGYNTYNQFWSANTARVAALLAYILVVLTAMQVGLATQKLQGNASFQAASWGFTVFSMVAPLAGLGLVGGVLAGMFVGNWVAARRYWKRRMRWIEGRQEWTKTEHENGR